jgi:hypothetical protein
MKPNVLAEGEKVSYKALRGETKSMDFLRKPDRSFDIAVSQVGINCYASFCHFQIIPRGCVSISVPPALCRILKITNSVRFTGAMPISMMT